MISVFVLFTLPLAAQSSDENWSHCRGKEPKLKIIACTKIIESGTQTTDNLARAFANRGWGYHETGNLDRAIQDYDRVIELKPDAGTYGVRGAIYFEKEDPDRAIQDFDEAIRRIPQNPLVRCFRGDVYFFLKGDYDRAINDYNVAISLWPAYAQCLERRGTAYSDNGDYDRALKD